MSENFLNNLCDRYDIGTSSKSLYDTDVLNTFRFQDIHVLRTIATI